MKKRLAQYRKLNRTPSHKWSMLRNMVTSLIEHERIVTTEAKAKELRHLADAMITLAKKGSSHNVNIPSNNYYENGGEASGKYLHYRRRAKRVVRGDWNITKLFEVLGPRYLLRQGGYTRVLKLAKRRAGDNAPMAVIEYVDRPGEIRAARPPTILTTTTTPRSATEDEGTANTSSAPSSSSPMMKGMEEALRNMGISSIDDLVSKKERHELEAELQQEQQK
mmetsp:Transcript_55457/g.64019  ORF Transcript_55457/g.64019 Transcript_55457/m.64019 type:complete len:222 (+) Transcript_55457:246-911(+)